MRPTVRRASTLLLAALVVGGAVEQTYRVYLFGWAAFSYARVNSVHGILGSGLLQASENPELVFELKPGVDSRFMLAKFRTNSAGLSDDEYSKNKPPRTRRIALAGSSVCMPAGVALEESWHYRVERTLDAREPSWRHEIINFSVAGYSSRQQVAVLKSKAFAYHPDLVAFSITANSPYLMRLDESYRKSFVVMPETRPFWRSFARKSIALRFKPPDAAASRSAEFLARVDAELKEARATADGHGVPLCFLILNTEPAGPKNAVRALEQLASKHASCVINTSDAFAGAEARDFYIYPIDRHPNSKAHRMIAEALAPRLARELGMASP